MSYYLYKNPEQYDTLNIVQFLHFIGKNGRPKSISECNHPNEVENLPSIFDIDNEKWYIGYENVVEYYEKTFDIKNLQKVADAFKEKYPNYRIHN